jgi:transposase InsO family protein
MNDVFELCGLSRQAHHQALRRAVGQEMKSVLYIRLMEQAREIHPGMGLRTMYDMIQPEGIGRDSFVSLGLQEGFRLKTIEKYTRTTYSVKSSRYKNLLEEVILGGINEVWSSDITYYYGFDHFFYIVLIMDVYSRRIVGYSVADNMRADNNLRALQMALQMRGIADYEQKLIHHSDKGTQYASDNYIEALTEAGIRISMCKEVYENTHIERLNDTIKNQYLYRMEITNEKQLKVKLDEVVKSYNETRPHQSIDHLAPIQYEASLLDIPKEKRDKMTIYTIKTNPNEDRTTQMELFNII